MNEKNLLVRQDRRRNPHKPFDKEQMIEETLIMMRILWNKHGYSQFNTRIDLKLDKERFKLKSKDDFKNIIRVFAFVSKMKRKPVVKFVFKPRKRCYNGI